MTIIQRIESFFGWGTPKPTLVPPNPSQFQALVDTAGKITDAVENDVNALQPFVAVYPPLAGYLSAIAIAVHALDAYVDSLETPAPAAVPAANPPQAPAAPGALPTAQL